MSKDTYNATWVSYSSISDWLECPRAYYLKNVYKDPKTRRKLQIISPPLALGQAVHEVIESLSKLKTEDRFKQSLLEKYEVAWKKISGKRGGFVNKDIEFTYQERGRLMLNNIEKDPGLLREPAIKVKTDLPKFWLSEEEEIILCGKIDWMQYLPETDSVHIIDFKTGKQLEGEASLQLPIYFLLASNCQTRPVTRASYWYLEQVDGLQEQTLPDKEDSLKKILDVARKIKLARKLEKFACPHNGCRACSSYEKILAGEGELVAHGDYDKDIYILPQNKINNEEALIL